MTPEDKEILMEMLKGSRDGKDVIVNPPDVAVRMLEDVCARTGLDWKSRLVYLMKRGNKWSVELSIDGFRAVAGDEPEYGGQEGPLYTTGPDQPWTDNPPETPPYSAKVGVVKSGKVTWAVAKYADYNAGSPIWRKFPATMTAKCAEALALRKAFPRKLGGLYTADEMAQAGKEGAATRSEGSPREKKGTNTPLLSSSPTLLPDDTSGFALSIAAAASREELLAIGKTIQSTSLGVEQKMELSRQYNAKKAQEGWA